MARVTVEDCVDKVPNRFELVMLAAHRAREISAGSQPTVDRDNDKNPVVALREIGDETQQADDLRERLIGNRWPAALCSGNLTTFRHTPLLGLFAHAGHCLIRVLFAENGRFLALLRVTYTPTNGAPPSRTGRAPLADRCRRPCRSRQALQSPHGRRDDPRRLRLRCEGP